MAVPKRRISRARRGNRRIQQALEKVQLSRCSNCGASIRPHHICASCGHYRGKQITIGRSV